MIFLDPHQLRAFRLWVLLDIVTIIAVIIIAVFATAFILALLQIPLLGPLFAAVFGIVLFVAAAWLAVTIPVFVFAAMVAARGWFDEDTKSRLLEACLLFVRPGVAGVMALSGVGIIMLLPAVPSIGAGLVLRRAREDALLRRSTRSSSGPDGSA